MRIDPRNYKLSVIPVFSPTKQPVLANKYSGGGHQTLLALAYKLAVAETVGRPSLLLIDEPTDGTDIQNLGNLLEHIPTLSNVFSQTFMITHHGLAQEKADNIIEVTRSAEQSVVRQ
ncbi:MAG: hypothetical protein ACFFCQ_03405 [Promethearchaeota archaeon]